MRSVVEQQLRHNDCGIAAVKMICNIHGVHIGRDFIEENIFLNEKGSNLQDIKNFFDNQHFSVEFNLLDINSLRFRAENIRAYLPCILPVKHRHGLHYVVIRDVRKNKLEVLDPSKGRNYLWSFSELLHRAHISSASYDYVSSSKLIAQIIRDELSTHNIDPARAELLDKGEVLNKLTYFSYVSENFGFSNAEAATRFLEDLLFNQQMNMLPREFRSVRIDKEKMKIRVPVVLTVRKPPATTLPDARAQQLKQPNVYRRLYNEMKPYHRLWYIYIFAAIFPALLGQVTIFSNQILIDNILPGYNLSLLVMFAIGLGVFRLFELTLSLYKRFISIHLANIFDNHFLTSFIEKLNSFPIRYIHNFSRGDLTERIKDSLRLKTFFIRFFTRILIDAVVIVYSLSVLFILHWKVALIVLAVLVMFIIWFYLLTPYIRENENQRFLVKSSLFSTLFENIDGLQVIKSFRLENEFMQRLFPKVKSILAIQRKVRMVNLVNKAVIDFIIIVAGILIIVLLARGAIVFNSISTGQIITFLALSRQVFHSLSSLLDENLDVQENEVILNRYFDFGKHKEQSATIMHNKIRSFDLQSIEFRDVGFEYLPQKPVFSGLNITIRSGEKILLEGSNGAGKSTFCKVLSLLYAPNLGDIFINGEKFNFYNQTALRKKILLISNEDMLFNDTLGYNMSFCYDSGTSEVLALAKEIGLYDFINEKEEGIDFIINEQGRNLSTGQRKKILMMRAFLSQAELLILDETLSGIDRQSRESIERYINQQINRSIIIISHEPLNIVNFSRNLMMQNGNIKQLQLQGV